MPRAFPALAGLVAAAVGTRGLAGASKGSFESALREPYAGYCAHAPASQQDAFPGPLPEPDLAAAGLQLAAVQVIFRHGARDLSKDHKCFSPRAEAFGGCHLRSFVSYAGLGEHSAGVPLVKTILDAYPTLPPHPDGQPGCGEGVLLDEAVGQTRALARAFQEAYFQRLPQVPSSNSTRMYSTDKERTLGTLFMLQNFLFHGLQGRPPAQALTRPLDSDHWDLNQDCPRASKRHARSYDDEEIAKLAFPEFATQWRQAAGTDFQPAFKDCLLVASCSRQTGLRLPEGLQPNSTLFKEALRVSLELFQDRYTSDLEAMRLLAAPSLLEVDDFLQLQATGSGPMVALWATHDTTIMVMLVAMGLWSGQWPPYTDSLTIEVYRPTGGQRGDAFFRLLHAGRALPLPWCGARMEPDGLAGSGLCPVSNFLPESIAELRDRQLLAIKCAGLGSTELSAGDAAIRLGAAQDWRASAAGAFGCVALVLVGFAAGVLSERGAAARGAAGLGAASGRTVCEPLLQGSGC